MKLFFIFFLGIFFLVSCGPEPWPPDSKAKLYNSIGNSFDKNVFNGTEFDQYIDCLLNKCKSQYPDFRKFEIAIDGNKEEIIKLSIVCLKQVYGQDFNSIFKILSNNQGITTLKEELSPALFAKYKECLIISLSNEFTTVDAFYTSMFNDQQRISTILQRIDNDCGQEIAQLLRNEKANVENLQRLINTPIENLNIDEGYYEVINETQKPVKLAIGYYYYGLRWKGWVSEGWFLLSPGEITKVYAPLNNFQKLNSIFYFHATTQGGSWSGENSFVVSDDNFKIANADLYQTYSNSPNYLKLISKFKEKKYSFSSNNYILRLTD